MATRRSADPEQGWTAGASVFSGRPDPDWPLPAADAAQLEALWGELQPLQGDAPEPPPLGYRGCWAAAPAGARRFTAYRGAVTCAEPAEPGRRAEPPAEPEHRAEPPAAPERRADPARAVERLILASAPDAALRDQLLKLAGLGEADRPPPA